MNQTGHSVFAFMESVAEKSEVSLHVITLFGFLDGFVKPGPIVGHTFWQYILKVNWIVAVAVVYTFIACLVLGILAVLLLSIVFRAKDEQRRNQFLARAGKWVLTIATIIGIIIATISRGGPVLHTPQDVIGIIMFRIVGFAAIGLSVLLIIRDVQSIHQHQAPVK